MSNATIHMEHIANENDIVAKAMGCNCNADIEHLIDIDGKKLINSRGTGPSIK